MSSGGTLCRAPDCDNVFEWIQRGRPRVFCGDKCAKRIERRIARLHDQHSRLEAGYEIHRAPALRERLLEIESTLVALGSTPRFVVFPHTNFPDTFTPLVEERLAAYFRFIERLSRVPDPMVSATNGLDR